MIDWLGNATALGPARWHPEPSSRGTFSILSTCVATLILCTWTAVHLNVPEHGKEHRQKWHRLGWLITGLLAPEFVAWNAWEQRRRVKELTKDMRQAYRKRHGLKEKLADDSFKHVILRSMKSLSRVWNKTLVALLIRPGDLEELLIEKELDDSLFWTDTQSWLVVAGGVVFDTSTAEVPFLPSGRTQLTLTDNGIVALFERWPALMPKLTVQDISMKSSSDGFVKLITCGQATWFCLQCITRLGTRLPVSLLELSVFAHALCCLITYSIWWHKPKDLRDPVRITGAQANSVAAAMCNLSSPGMQRVAYTHGKWRWVLDKGSVSTQLTETRCHAQVHRLRDVLAPLGLLINGELWNLYPQSGDPASSFRDPLWVDRATVTIDIHTIRRLQTIRSDDLTDWPATKFGQPASTHSPDLAISREEYSNEAPYFALTAATCLYGGIHAVAWNAAFLAQWQTILWRAASVSIMASGPLYYIYILAKISLWHCYLDRYRSGRKRGFVFLWTLCNRHFPRIAWLALAWYCICRGYLVIESFAMLAYLQPEMLELPDWTTYFPHIA